MDKPYAESCDQNKEPILSVIKPLLQDKKTVLEIGSGTGQHAVHFAAQMPHLTWQTSDQKDYLPGINMWLDDARLANVLAPFELDVKHPHWPNKQYDVIFSANTLHIMHWTAVQAFFSGVKDRLSSKGLLLIYGPFNYHYQYTSESNARFDEWLKARDPQSGIRDFEELNKLAVAHDMSLLHDYAMPANNRILCWQLD